MLEQLLHTLSAGGVKPTVAPGHVLKIDWSILAGRFYDRCFTKALKFVSSVARILLFA